MNSKKAKALRKKVGFHPSDDRFYDALHNRVNRKTNERMAGTIVSTGTRREYLQVKRSAS